MHYPWNTLVNQSHFLFAWLIGHGVQVEQSEQQIATPPLQQGGDLQHERSKPEVYAADNAAASSCAAESLQPDLPPLACNEAGNDTVHSECSSTECSSTECSSTSSSTSTSASAENSAANDTNRSNYSSASSSYIQA